MCNIKEYDKSINKIKDAFDAYFPLMKKLDKDIREVNGSICDSYHFMELNDLDVVRGYKAYKELQQKLQLRRKLKTNIDYLKSISEELNIAKNTFDALDKKYADPEYKPRVNDELFQSESVKTISKSKPKRAFKNVNEAVEYLRSIKGKKAIIKDTKISAAIECGKAYHGYLWFYEDNIISCKKIS